MRQIRKSIRIVGGGGRGQSRSPLHADQRRRGQADAVSSPMRDTETPARGVVDLLRDNVEVAAGLNANLTIQKRRQPERRRDPLSAATACYGVSNVLSR